MVFHASSSNPRSSKWGARLVAWALLSTSVGLSAGASAQSEEQRVAARAAADAGSTAMEEGRYAEAVDLFMRAESILPVPTLALRVARAHEKLGHFVQAREAYLRVIHAVLPSDAPPAFLEAQEIARSEIGAVKAKIAHLTIHVEGPPRDRLRVVIDGKAVDSALVGLPYPVDPGGHKVEVTAEGYRSVSGQSELSAGGQAELRLALEPDATASAAPEPTGDDPPSSSAAAASPADEGGIGGLTIAGLAALGVGAGGVVVGTVLVVQGLNTRARGDMLQQECQANMGVCSMMEREAIGALDEEARGYYTPAGVAYGIGGVLIATGVVLLVIDSGGSDSAMTVSPYFAGNSLGVVGTF